MGQPVRLRETTRAYRMHCTCTERPFAPQVADRASPKKRCSTVPQLHTPVVVIVRRDLKR